jgi:hypothetical protein
MIDPREKAAECERAIGSCPNLSGRRVLENLRQLWVVIEQDKSAGKADWHGDADETDKLHAEILKPEQ